MVQPYTSATQNNNKCPHGFPLGACPICSGMGGGAGKMRERNKARKSGEMTYAQCMAAWHKIQAQKEAKIQDRLDKVQDLKTQLKENRIMIGLDKVNQVFDKINKNLDKLISQINQLPKIFSTPLNVLLNNVIKPIINVAQNIFTNVIRMTSQITQKMMAVASVVFGEIQNFIEGFKSLKITKTIKIFLTLFSDKDEEETDEKEEIKEKELMFKKIKEVVRGMFRIKNKSKGKKDENEFV